MINSDRNALGSARRDGNRAATLITNWTGISDENLLDNLDLRDLLLRISSDTVIRESKNMGPRHENSNYFDYFQRANLSPLKFGTLT